MSIKRINLKIINLLNFLEFCYSRSITIRMAHLLSAVGLLLVVSIALVTINQVDANYGKVTCLKETKIPSPTLLGTFVKAGCNLPTKWPASDEALGSIHRCVWMHLKTFTAPDKFDRALAMKVFFSVFPKKYHNSLKTKMTACLDTHQKNCKDVASDKSGKSWAGLHHCFENWYNNDLCKKTKS